MRTSINNPYIILLVEVLVLMVANLPATVVYLDKAVKPYFRGFFCDDESITYPYMENSVTIQLLVVISLLIPVSFIFISECILYNRSRLREEPYIPAFNTPNRSTLGRFSCHPLVFNMVIILAIIWFGMGLVLSCTEVTKYLVGRLRPHFLTVCKPDISLFNCTPTAEYIITDVCTGDQTQINEARLSFPSGHSSFAFYTSVFLVIYIQVRLTLREVKLIRPLLQFLFLMLAVYISLSRISDYWHHPTDVLAGSVIGALTAWATTLVIFNLQSLSGDIHSTIRETEIPSLHSEESASVP